MAIDASWGLLWALAQIAASSAATVSSTSDLPYDENGRLSTHLLVYPEPCESFIEGDIRYELYGRETRGVSGDALFAFFSETDEDYRTKEKESGGRLGKARCRAACVERGMERSVIHGVMPIYRFEGNTEAKDLTEWLFVSCQKVEFGFINYHRPDVKKPINVYWINTKGERQAHGELKWGEQNTLILQTYLGHRWLFEDPATEEVLLDHIVEFNGIRTIGRHPSLVDPTVDFTSRIRRTLNGEWNKHQRVMRTFTKLGFGKGRLPVDVFASMDAFNYNNEEYRALEEWDSKGVYVNYWESDVFFIQAPWDLKLVWQTRIKDLVEKWAGVELENTALYGLRRYEEGARLLTHVDRISTHAASVIINVAQGNVTRPWTIELYDHADRLHEVVMEPGDIVYYESAKCLHGRNTPLQGKGAYYVNMFSHYRPVGDPEWYSRPNPEGTPEPLMDVGECRLEEGLEERYSQGAVKCEDPTVGPHLSPSMSKATSGTDLFDWWRKVGDVSSEGSVEEGARHEEL